MLFLWNSCYQIEYRMCIRQAIENKQLHFFPLTHSHVIDDKCKNLPLIIQNDAIRWFEFESSIVRFIVCFILQFIVPTDRSKTYLVRLIDLQRIFFVYNDIIKTLRISAFLSEIEPGTSHLVC